MERVRVSATDPDPVSLAHAADVVARGGLVVFPTDTFYGLGADPRVPEAVARVCAAKGRREGQALPLVAADLEQVEAAAIRLSPLTRRIAGRFWPGPLTLVIDAVPEIAVEVHGGLDTVAIRVPDQAVARGLASHLGFPVVATSANRSGAGASASPDEVAAALDNLVDLMLDAGLTPGGEPSTIVDARGAAPVLIRAGAVPFSRVLEAL